jgi:hypothetical protein
MVGDFEATDATAIRGNDTFAFRPLNGNDIIYDFHQGEDIIELGGLFDLPAKATGRLPAKVPQTATKQTLQDFADLNIQTVDTNSDTVVDSSVIHIDASNSVTVVGVTALTAADFHFVV